MNLSDFIDTAEALNGHARQRGLTGVAFRGRPGPRSLRRLEDGAGLITVEVGARPHAVVLNDMIAGLLAFNSRPDDEDMVACLYVAVEELWRDPPPNPDHRPSDGSEPY